MTTTDRMERILARLLISSMKGASQQEKIAELNLAGFSNLEIADLINTTTAVVAQTLYSSRKGKTPRPRKRAKAAGRTPRK